MSAPPNYQFYFRSTYDGVSHFTAYDRSAAAKLTLRFTPKTGELRCLSADISPGLLAAFNDWRRDKHDSDIAYLTERYGALAASEAEPFVPALSSSPLIVSDGDQ